MVFSGGLEFAIGAEIFSFISYRIELFARPGAVTSSGRSGTATISNQGRQPGRNVNMELDHLEIQNQKYPQHKPHNMVPSISMKRKFRTNGE